MYRNEKTLLTQSLATPDLPSILIDTKNHGVLETSTKIQFHLIFLNLTNIKQLTNWQVFISMKLNLKMNVNRPSILWFSSKFRINIDSSILTQFGPIFEPIIVLIPIDFEIEPPILESHISLMGKECDLQFFDSEPTFEPKLTLKSKLNLSHIGIRTDHSWMQIIPQSHIPFLDQGIYHNDS